MASYSDDLWNEVRAYYGTGRYSFRQLEEIFKARYKGNAPGASAIRKRAVKDAWPKDLTAQVNDAVRGGLVRGGDGDARSEAEAVRDAAAAVVEIITSQRGRLERLGLAVDKLLEQVEAVIKGEAEGIEVPIWRKGQKVGEKVTFSFLGEHESMSDMLFKLMRMTEVLHRMQRTAFNIENGEGDDGDSHEAWLEQIGEGGGDEQS